MENTEFKKEENKGVGILLKNLENCYMRNGRRNSSLFELANKLNDLNNQKKQRELELKSINEMIFEMNIKFPQLMTLKSSCGGTTFCLTTNTM